MKKITLDVADIEDVYQDTIWAIHGNGAVDYHGDDNILIVCDYTGCDGTVIFGAHSGLPNEYHLYDYGMSLPRVKRLNLTYPQFRSLVKYLDGATDEYAGSILEITKTDTGYCVTIWGLD